MSKRRLREADEFPQQLQDSFSCATVTGGAGTRASSAITQTEWRMPVELDLNHPIFMECSKIHCTQDTPLAVITIGTGIAGSPAFLLVRELKIMKEARGTTTWPNDSDRATLATFRMQSSATALSAILMGWNFSEMSQWEHFEDARTGYGELIAQPRLFVLTRTTIVSSGAVNPEAIIAKDLSLSMHYRLTDRVGGKEYLTELIAKFT